MTITSGRGAAPQPSAPCSRRLVVLTVLLLFGVVAPDPAHKSPRDELAGLAERMQQLLRSGRGGGGASPASINNWLPAADPLSTSGRSKDLGGAARPLASAAAGDQAPAGAPLLASGDDADGGQPQTSADDDDPPNPGSELGASGAPPPRSTDDLRSSLLAKLRARAGTDASGTARLQSLTDTLLKSQASWDGNGATGVSYCWNAALGTHKKCSSKGVLAFDHLPTKVECERRAAAAHRKSYAWVDTTKRCQVFSSCARYKSSGQPWKVFDRCF